MTPMLSDNVPDAVKIIKCDLVVTTIGESVSSSYILKYFHLQRPNLSGYTTTIVYADQTPKQVATELSLHSR